MPIYWVCCDLWCQILKQFGPLSDEFEKLRRFSKHRSAEIKKALAAGISPPSRSNDASIAPTSTWVHCALSASTIIFPMSKKCKVEYRLRTLSCSAWSGSFLCPDDPGYSAGLQILYSIDGLSAGTQGIIKSISGNSWGILCQKKSYGFAVLYVCSGNYVPLCKEPISLGHCTALLLQGNNLR